MSVDLSKLILSSNNNAFKNVNRYSGELVMPTAVAAGLTETVTVTVQLTEEPVFTQFYCYFLELTDAIAGVGNSQWYSQNVAGNFAVAVFDITSASYISALIYPVIVGSTVVVTGKVFNPFGAGAVFAPYSVPFEFVEYTLAN